jgi:hypothetical protein
LTFDVTVLYRDARGDRQYEDSMQLDLSMFKGPLYIAQKGFRDLVEEIEKVRGCADSMVKNTAAIAEELRAGIHLGSYEFHVVTEARKQTLFSKLVELQSAWTYIYRGSSEPYFKLDEVQARCLSLAREIANLASACYDLDDESPAHILQIASRMGDLGRFTL